MRTLSPGPPHRHHVIAHRERIVCFGECLLSSLNFLEPFSGESCLAHPPLVVLILLILVAVLLGSVGVLAVLYRRLAKRSALQRAHTETVQPQQLAKTRQQLYREIARHQSTEQLLRDTQQFMQSIIDSMPSILIGVTADGVVTHWNLAATRGTGLHADQALGAHINSVYPDLPMIPHLVKSAIVSGEAFNREKLQQGKGSTTTFVELTIYPLTAHNIGGAVVLIEDVTKQTHVESMLIHSEKMMSLGEMAAGLAHEINNPLASILHNAQNIERRTLSDLASNIELATTLQLDLAVMQQYLEQRGIVNFLESIRSSGEQAAQIVKNMLEFSRSSYQAHAPQDIQLLVNEAVELTRKSLELRTSMGIEMPKVLVVVGDDIPLVPCSATEIKQVLVNLLRNAAQAFQSDEYGAPLDPQVIIELSREDTHLLIEISDNGPGMPEAIKRHIFEPFFTTKDTGQGTGLGLSVTYFIVTEHHRGSIELDSTPGQGTTFSIRLPLGAVS